MSDDVVARLRALCLSFPGAREVVTWGHPTLRVGDKMFAACGAPPDGVVTMSCKCTRDLQAGIPELPGYFRPGYVGDKGWLGIRLDGTVPWDDIAVHVDLAWRLTAPKRVAAAHPLPR
jgi:predicted DNA-binding protein (MmcQ/YjbR family)